MTETDTISASLLLCAYEQYARKLNGRTRQFVEQDASATKVSKQGQIKFHFNAKWLGLLIALKCVFSVPPYGTLSNSQIKHYLTNSAKDSQVVVTTSTFD